MDKITVVNRKYKKFEITDKYSLTEFFEKFGNRLDVVIIETMDNVIIENCFEIKKAYLTNDGDLCLNLNEDICIYDESDMFISILKPREYEVAKFYRKVTDDYYFEVASIRLK